MTEPHIETPPQPALSKHSREIITAEEFQKRIKTLAAASKEEYAELWDLEIQSPAALLSKNAKKVKLGRCIFPQGLRASVDDLFCHDCQFGPFLESSGGQIAMSQCMADRLESYSQSVIMDANCSFREITTHSTMPQRYTMKLFGEVNRLNWRIDPSFIKQMEIISDSPLYDRLRVRDWICVHHVAWFRYFQAAFPGVSVIFMSNVTKLA